MEADLDAGHLLGSPVPRLRPEVPLLLIDSTPVRCARGRETGAPLSDLADYGYCASHFPLLLRLSPWSTTRAAPRRVSGSASAPS